MKDATWLVTSSGGRSPPMCEMTEAGAWKPSSVLMSVDFPASFGPREADRAPRERPAEVGQAASAARSVENGALQGLSQALGDER